MIEHELQIFDDKSYFKHIFYEIQIVKDRPTQSKGVKIILLLDENRRG
jgi:hypothetical protein